MKVIPWNWFQPDTGRIKSQSGQRKYRGLQKAGKMRAILLQKGQTDL